MKITPFTTHTPFYNAKAISIYTSVYSSLLYHFFHHPLFNKKQKNHYEKWLPTLLASEPHLPK